MTHSCKPVARVAISVAAFLMVLPLRAQDLPAELLAWPDTIYTNATLITLDVHELNDDPGTIAEAMAVRDGTIQAVGSADAGWTRKSVAASSAIPFRGSTRRTRA